MLLVYKSKCWRLGMPENTFRCLVNVLAVILFDDRNRKDRFFSSSKAWASISEI